MYVLPVVELELLTFGATVVEVMVTHCQEGTVQNLKSTILTARERGKLFDFATPMHQSAAVVGVSPIL